MSTATSSNQPRPQPVCTVCDGTRTMYSLFGGYRFQGTLYDRLQCASCGFIFVHPMPTGAAFAAMYSDSYFEDYYAGGDDVGYEGNAGAVSAKADTILDRVQKYMPAGTLLDVGCAGGHFLAAAKQRGYQGTGIEVNPKMAAHARAAYGVEVIDGTYESADFEAAGRRFDIIYMGDALEHLPDPRSALRRLSGLLAPNGVFVLNGPITLNTALFTLALRMKLMLGNGRTAWYADGPPYHLSEWNATTMRRMLVENGFDPLEFRTHEEPGRPKHVVVDALKRQLTGAESTALYLKTMSAWTTNALFRPFEWGDRVIAISRLKSGALTS